MTHQTWICAAGNTEVPAALVLSKKGYIVSVSIRSTGTDSWHAEKGELDFQAASLIELLGLVTMYEVRGVNWAAADQEIDASLKKFAM